MNILPKPSGCKLCSYLRLPSCETPVPGSSRNRAFSSRMCERLQPVTALQHFQMTEAANGTPVACLPMVFHGTTRELVVLGNALVIGRLLGELDDVADFIFTSRVAVFTTAAGFKIWLSSSSNSFFRHGFRLTLPGLRRFRKARQQQNRSNTIGLKANKFRSRCPLSVIRGCQCRPMSAVTPIADKGGCARIVR